MNKPLTSFQILDKSAEILKVVAHPIRLAIIEMLLKNGEFSVTDIYQKLDIEQSVVSYHLKNLRMVNIVVSNRKGTKIFYSLTSDDIAKIFEHITNMGKL